MASASFDQELTNVNARADNLRAMAQICAALGDVHKLEGVLQKLVVLEPDQPEARYDLAALEAVTGQTNAALKNLGLCLARQRQTPADQSSRPRPGCRGPQ